MLKYSRYMPHHHQKEKNIRKVKLSDIIRNPDFFIPAFITAGLFIGGILHGFKFESHAHYVWLTTLIVGSLPLMYRVLKVLKQGKVGVDLIAIAAIFASFWATEYLAGVVILLMLSTGEALEAFAQAKAKSELTNLMDKAPSIAHIKGNHGLRDVPVDMVKIHDRLMVKPGEVIPIDGIVVFGISNVDEAVITGESLPVEKKPGSAVYSGAVNQDNPLEIRASKTSADSKYQVIVKLVKEAQNAQSPTVRLADRYALFFNIITFAAAGVTWLVSHDPSRVLSVFVVASPCPLILAVPIAIISGISKAASRGIIIKNGTALEKLGEVKGLVFDKTGTLTIGTPEVVGVVSVCDLSEREITHLAVSIEQLSVHVFARSIVQYAQNKNMILEYPEKFEELFGQGVTASLKGKKYVFGKLTFLKEQKIKIDESITKHHQTFQAEGKTAVYLGDEHALLGYVVFADIVRPETKTMFSSLKEHNLNKIIMLTGDKQAVAKTIASNVGIMEYRAELLPEEKVAELKKIQNEYGPMAMIGDGVNDAPALAIASVGIALGSHGATAASEAGDIVIMVNDIHRVHDAVHIAQNAMKLAKQGIVFGMGTSLLLIIFACFGLISPIAGAVMQELLDAVVILNALRVNFQKID
jgi:heavy metal translocating P-type ATPase